MCHSHCTKTNRVFHTPRFFHSFHFSIPFFLSSLFLSLFYFLEKSATSCFCYRKSHFQRPVPNSSTETSHTSLITIYNYVYPASSFSAASLIWYCVYLERKNYYFCTLTLWCMQSFDELTIWVLFRLCIATPSSKLIEECLLDRLVFTISLTLRSYLNITVLLFRLLLKRPLSSLRQCK